MNVDTGSNESHHKLTKVAAKLTQKNMATFEEQTSNRLDDFHVLNLSLEELEGRPLWDYENGYCRREVEEEEPKGEHTGGMKFRVHHDVQTDQLLPLVVTSMKDAKELQLDREFLAFVHALEKAIGVNPGKLEVCAEHTREGQIFRAHPNYRNNGVWQDWVTIQWGGDYGDLPAQIWGFLVITEFEDGKTCRLPEEISDGYVVHNGTWAIVENAFILTKEDKEKEEKERRDKEANKKKGKKKSKRGNDDNDNGTSVMWLDLRLERRKTVDGGNLMRRKFYLAEVESFKAPLVVIPNVGTIDRYLMMKPKSDWADDFVDFIKQDNRLDQEDMEDGEGQEE